MRGEEGEEEVWKRKRDGAERKGEEGKIGQIGRERKGI